MLDFDPSQSDTTAQARSVLGPTPRSGRPIALVHGWDGSPESMQDLGRFFSRELGVPVADIDLAKWLTLNDDVTYGDICIALEAAWGAHPELSKAPEVDIVTHSTGALIVRDWMTNHWKSRRDTTIRHLLMLAPANFGSPLAHEGQSIWGMVYETIRHFNPGVGKHILQGLELGSPYTWELAQRDVLCDEPWYGANGILATVLVGNSPSDGPAAAVSKNGSDGVVAVCTANLNVRTAQIVYDEQGKTSGITYGPVRPDALTAFGVVPNRNHGTILQPDTGDPEYAQWLIRALTLTPGDFAEWCDLLDAETDNLYKTTEIGDAYRHRYQNLVVRAQDVRLETEVAEFFVEFHDECRAGLTGDLGFMFHNQVVGHVHNYSLDGSFRSLPLDITKSSGMSGIGGIQLTAWASPIYRGPDQPVGYTQSEPVDLGEPSACELLSGNQTLLLEIYFTRAIDNTSIFEFQPLPRG